MCSLADNESEINTDLVLTTSGLIVSFFFYFTHCSLFPLVINKFCFEFMKRQACVLKINFRNVSLSLLSLCRTSREIQQGFTGVWPIRAENVCPIPSIIPSSFLLCVLQHHQSIYSPLGL